MKKKVIVRAAAFVVMTATVCTFAFSSGSKHETKKAGPLYQRVTCIYTDPATGQNSPGTMCIMGFGQTCVGNIYCVPTSNPPGGPR